MPGSSEVPEDLKSQPLSLPAEVSGFCAARLCCPTGTCVLSNRSCIRCALDTSGGPLQSLKSGRGGGMHSRTRSSRAQSHPRSVIVACFFVTWSCWSHTFRATIGDAPWQAFAAERHRGCATFGRASPQRNSGPVSISASFILWQERGETIHGCIAHDTHVSCQAMPWGGIHCHATGGGMRTADLKMTLHDHRRYMLKMRVFGMIGCW